MTIRELEQRLAEAEKIIGMLPSTVTIKKTKVTA